MCNTQVDATLVERWAVAELVPHHDQIANDVCLDS